MIVGLHFITLSAAVVCDTEQKRFFYHILVQGPLYAV